MIRLLRRILKNTENLGTYRPDIRKTRRKSSPHKPTAINSINTFHWHADHNFAVLARVASNVKASEYR